MNQDDKEMLRDIFAGLALTAIIIRYRGEDTESATITAYEYADAMMEARKPKEEKGIVAVKRRKTK
jgi:hypothetical protein